MTDKFMIYKPKEALIEVADVLVKHGLMGEIENRDLRIRLEYSELKSQGHGRGKLIKRLSNNYHISYKSIERIVSHIDTEERDGGQEDKSLDKIIQKDKKQKSSGGLNQKSH